MRFRRQPAEPAAVPVPAPLPVPVPVPAESPRAISHAEVAAALSTRRRARTSTEVPAHIRLALEDRGDRTSPLALALRGLAAAVLVAALACGVAAVTGIGPSPLSLIGL